MDLDSDPMTTPTEISYGSLEIPYLTPSQRAQEGENEASLEIPYMTPSQRAQEGEEIPHSWSTRGSKRQKIQASSDGPGTSGPQSHQSNSDTLVDSEYAANTTGLFSGPMSIVPTSPAAISSPAPPPPSSPPSAQAQAHHHNHTCQKRVSCLELNEHTGVIYATYIKHQRNATRENYRSRCPIKDEVVYLELTYDTNGLRKFGCVSYDYDPSSADDERPTIVGIQSFDANATSHWDLLNLVSLGHEPLGRITWIEETPGSFNFLVKWHCEPVICKMVYEFSHVIADGLLRQ
ncbi:hypothetical protein BJ508DRAFT_306051 [Ascobolus immersus RN42]|uniref:Uncharacterized protein n=1 Tax=Ascobolus immersus RN42 TaxID=1160509 RepID=A0A3N4I751_ASCIM|nr:hypothetical protein BJ508DRAFT_306051 [Ascobolus immersus RN42]